MAVSVVDPDAILVKEHLGGERDAFDVLYRRYFPRLVRLCTRLTKDAAAAEDIAQETLVRAHDHLERFDQSRPMWPWLKTIATRVLIDHTRSHGRELPMEDRPEEGSHAEHGWTEEREVLLQALSKLPPRQRTAVALRYIEDWDGPQAAEFLGLSGLAFRQILHRAKRKLQTEYRKIAEPAWGAVLVPIGWLRRVSHEAAARLRPNASGIEGAKLVASFTALNLAVAAVAILGRAGHDAPPSAHEPTRPNTQVAGSIAAPAQGDRSPSVDGPRASDAGGAIPQTTSAPVAEGSPENDLAGQAGDRGKDIAQSITDPNGHVAEPEDSNIVWVEYSPRFATDGTVYAAGVTECKAAPCPPVLFRSTDGGAAWTRLEADGLHGSQILLPPAFGAGDERIFAFGALGLEVSSDGGASFRPAAVGPSGGAGSASISPAFNTSDPIILIGDQSLMQYRDDTRTVGPTTPIPGRGPLHPAFSPAYETDRLLLVGGLQVDVAERDWAASVFRCSDNVCSGTALPVRSEAPRVRPAPDYSETGHVYAFTSQGLFLSTDRAFSFSPLTGPSRHALRDVAPAGAGLVFAVARTGGVEGGGELFVSSDEGATWTRTDDPLLGGGVASVRASGRHVLASLQTGGVACSIDGGATWAARCPAA
jgi:RNA polymerase sigma-70 factor (ECF subfamily)